MLGMLGGNSQTRFEVSTESQIGECRRAAQRLAEVSGLDGTAVGRVGIVATELATNLVRHASGGELLLQALTGRGDPQIELLAIDRGPGMADVQRCLQDGYSTGGTLGAGLGAVTRLSGTFDIYSIAGQGTIVLARLGSGPDAARGEGRGAAAARGGDGFELGAICVPMPGEIECGDSWHVASDGDAAAMLVVDGLGHGVFAAAAARAAGNAFAAEPFRTPVEAIQHMHRAMSGTRGAAAACALLPPHSHTLEYAGIGNISGSMISPQRSQGMVSHNGTLGTQLLRRVQQFSYAWPRDGHVVMHSDGISARWSVSAYEGLHARHSAVIAAVLYRDHGRGRDDATVLVLGRRPVGGGLQ
ncbi:MAG TPA: SpoIIE family protein phosphatase [Steroidobacteraceae bacterium]|jgi:anti-sigma regulatory factor (Ser/Thr protein kinase)|nr:SpoIIE family protein phosphatase [Steroidobacteraceae bacterium]